MNDRVNPGINCSVANCAYHYENNCCTLNEIKVGCCDSVPKTSASTECASFQLGSGNKTNG